MRRSVLLCLTLTLVSACQGDDATRPKFDPASSPTKSISDGNHCAVVAPGCIGGNPDFFFLPPLVRDPRGSPNWEAGAANASLQARIDICQLDATTEAAIKSNPDAAACKSAGYRFTTTVGSKNISFGTLDDADIDALKFIISHYTSFGEPYYHYGWKAPTQAVGTTAPPIFYRVRVSVGSTPLGYLDLESVNNFAQLLNVHTGEFVPMTGGLRIPINFRIERYALCGTPGVGPCGSGTVDLTVGGTVQTVLPGDTKPSGISLPPGAGTTTTTITVQSCPGLNPRVTDLPTFGGCVRVTADPQIPAFTVPATVFNCNVSDLTISTGSEGQVYDHQQADRITLHKLDYIGEQPVLTALPHAPACGATPPPPSVTGSIGGLFERLRQGNVKEAVREVAALLIPKPLYAARFIDLGGGGFAPDISDFQFALPANFVKDPSTDGVVVDAGGVVTPTVTVLDLDGSPVRGATVRFGTSTGSAAPLSIVTGPNGRASTVWTVSSSVAANSLTASGRGIAGSDYNGPRVGIDPFQPIQTSFNPLPTDEPVRVLTGSVTFGATALLPPFDQFGYGGQWQYLLIGSGPAPAGWEQAAFGMTGWSPGVAPFGAAGCEGLPAAVTSWPLGSTAIPSDILLRKSFSTRTPGPLQITVMIDNDVQVFVDGTQVSDGFFVHEGCANLSPPTFTVGSLPAGNHVLALRARDRGVVAFVDATVSSPR